MFDVEPGAETVYILCNATWQKKDAVGNISASPQFSFC
jgi:hypothetical protein